jgi:hypothetical protein
MNVVNNIINKYAEAKANTKPTAHLLRYELVTPQIAKVVASVSHDAGVQDNRAALASLFKGRATPIANSFRAIDTFNGQAQRMAMVGFVAANVLAQELTPEVQANFKEVAKNVLMDEHDRTMWQVAEVGGRKFIRRQHQEDLSELMHETATVANLGISRQYTEISSLTIDTEGQFNVVAFVDPEHLAIRTGYIVEHASFENNFNLAVLCKDSTELSHVDERLVVQCAYNVDPNNQLTQAMQETAGFADSEVLKRYYAKVYGFSPEYLRELDQEIDQQAKA